MSADWPWNILGLDGPADKKTIMKAYAAKLKTSDRDDPNVFQALRQAREYALKICGEANTAARPNMREVAYGNSGASNSHPIENKSIAVENENSELVAEDDSSKSEPNAQNNIPKNEDIAFEHKRRNAPAAYELDQEFEAQPDQPTIWETAAINGFWEDYKSAIESNQYAEAAKCLDRPIAQDREIRQKAEQIAIDDLKTKSPNFRFHVDDLDLFEGEFQWVSDSISLKNRAGYFPNLVSFQSEWSQLTHVRRYHEKYKRPEASEEERKEKEEKNDSTKQLTSTELLVVTTLQNFLISGVVSIFWLFSLIHEGYLPSVPLRMISQSDIPQVWFFVWLTGLTVSFYAVLVFQGLFLIVLNRYYRHDPLRTSEVLGILRKSYRSSSTKYKMSRGAIYLVLLAVLGAAYVTHINGMIKITLYLGVFIIGYGVVFFVLNDFLGEHDDAIFGLKRRTIALVSIIVSLIFTTWVYGSVLFIIT